MINFLVYAPVFNLLIFFYRLVGNLGIAIIVIALIARLITFPLTQKQIKSATKNREFQKKVKEIQKQYANDQEKLAKEMARLQAEFLPGQIGGCLNIIIALVLLFQVRNVVIDLFNKGVHAFNQVAYVESMKYEEDYVEVKLPQGLEEGIHTATYTIPATNGNILEQVLTFAVTDTEEEAKAFAKQIKDAENDLTSDERKLREEKTIAANIGFYIDEFKDRNVIVGQKDSLRAYLRPPANASIDYENVQVKLDDKVQGPKKVSYNVGEQISPIFLGADLSRTGSEFQVTDIKTYLPYAVIALSVGITQFFASKVQTGMMTPEAEKKDEKKKKDEKEEPDFAELMAQSSQRMIYFFPILTFLMSLGYLGGARLFPSGVSLFWTAQNAFVIIQQLLLNRSKSKQTEAEEKPSPEKSAKISTDNKKIEGEKTANQKKKKKKKKKKK